MRKSKGHYRLEIEDICDLAWTPSNFKFKKLNRIQIGCKLQKMTCSLTTASSIQDFYYDLVLIGVMAIILVFNRHLYDM